jgi:predicted HTH domain antitoxin
MTTITLDFPEGAFSALRLSPKEFGAELRLAAAALWYSRGEISMERAAEVAGLTLRDFLKSLARLEIDVFKVDFDDLREELSRG